MIHIYTGDGKGKTTAAVGLAVRALGAGRRVLFVSYFKPDGSSEHDVLERLGAKLLRFSYRGNFFKRYDKEELAQAKRDFANFFADVEAATSAHDVIVHDEVVYAIHMGIVDVQTILAYVQRHREREIALTGRDYPQELVEEADYVTEMRKIKHPFDAGANPRKGIEY